MAFPNSIFNPSYRDGYVHPLYKNRLHIEYPVSEVLLGDQKYFGVSSPPPPDSEMFAYA